MNHLAAVELASLLAKGDSPWQAALARLAAAVSADAGVVVVAGPPPVRLAAVGLLPADADEIAAADTAAALTSRLARAGFEGTWVHDATSHSSDGAMRAVIAVVRRASDFTPDDRAVLDEVKAVIGLALSIEAERSQRAVAAEARRRLELRLEQLERQSTLGMVAAAVAHDLAAPVSALLMEGAEIRKRVLELSTMLPAAGPQLRNLVDDLRGLADHSMEATERARDILINFRLAARAGNDLYGGEQAVSVVDALRSCIRLVRPLAGDRVKIELHIEETLPSVAGARLRIEQAFTNLLVNAIHAAQVREGRAGLVKVRAFRSGDEIAVEIVDNGAGIPAEIKARIFEPFFSTKPPELGTGMGLPICREIVLAHGGRIEAESEHGRGATFRVILPLSSDRAGRGKRRPSVLIVNRESTIARMLRRALGSGYDVDTAGSDEEALDKLSRRGFDAIIADITSPDADGPILFAKVRRRWPGLEKKIIFAGTGAFTAASTAFLSSVPNRRFQTPITPEELKPIIDAVVAA